MAYGSGDCKRLAWLASVLLPLAQLAFYPGPEANESIKMERVLMTPTNDEKLSAIIDTLRAIRPTPLA